MNKTPNYNLNQWSRDDRVLMDDFNADNARLDTALAGLARSKADLSALAVKTEIAAGTYTGDGTAERVIRLGFTPKAVYVCEASGVTYVSGGSGAAYRGGLALPGAPAAYMGHPIVEIISGGFKVFCTDYKINNVTTNHYGANTANLEFHYIAFK